MPPKSKHQGNEATHEELRQRLIGGILASAMDAIITIDSHQRVVLFNPAAERMFQVSAEEAVGQPLDRFIPERFRQEHRKNVEEFGRTGVSVRHMNALGVVKGLRADGGEFPAEASISQVEAGGQKFYTAIVRDVSERQEAELTRTRLAAIVENSEDAILSKSLDGLITSWNASAERLFGYTAPEILGRSIMCLVPPERQAEEAALLEQVRLGHPVAAYETVRLDRAGQRIEVSLTLSPLRNAAGQIIGTSSTARDLRQRGQMQRTIEAGERTAHRQLAELRNIYACAPVGLAFLDKELRFGLVNQQLAQLAGLPAEQLLGRPVREVLPAVADQLEPLCRRVLETETPLADVEVSAPGPLHSPGTPRHWVTSYYPIRNSLLWGLNLVVSELTERQRAEKALEQSQHRSDALAADLAGLRRLQELSKRFVQLAEMPILLDAIIAAAMDLLGAQKGTIQLLDPATGQLRLLAQRGFDPQAPVSCSACLDAVKGACGRALHPGERAIVEDLAQSPDLAGTPLQPLLLAAGVRAMICNPLYCHVGHHVGIISLHFNAPHRPTERELGLLDVLTRQAADFIERAHAEQALREAHDRLRLAAQTAQLGTYERDLFKHQVHLNRACRELLGVPQGPLPPDIAYRSLYPADKDPVLAAVARAFDPALREVSAAEFRILRPDGTLRWVKGRARVLFDDSFSPARPHKVLGVLQDITERKLKDEELLQAKQELSRANADLEARVQERTGKLHEALAELEHMSYSMVHDMRAPLRALESFASILEQDPQSQLSDEARQLLARMRTAATRMDQLLTGAISYSGIVRSRLELGAVNPRRLLGDLLALHPGFQPPHAQVSLEGEFPWLLANEAALAQCLAELIRNAVKFVPPETLPRLRIWAERVRNPNPALREAADQWARLWFEDNGTGIPGTAQGRLFDLFQRAHGPEYPGTGIGLALVRKLVQRMGGRLGVESEQGTGSRFWLELPIPKAAA